MVGLYNNISKNSYVARGWCRGTHITGGPHKWGLWGSHNFCELCRRYPLAYIRIFLIFLLRVQYYFMQVWHTWYHRYVFCVKLDLKILTLCIWNANLCAYFSTFHLSKCFPFPKTFVFFGPSADNGYLDLVVIIY